MQRREKVELLTNGPVGEGTKFRETRVMHGREATEEMTFANFRPNRGYHLTAHNYGVAYLSTHEFEPADGGTRLTISFSGKPQTFFAKLMTPMAYFMQGMVRKCLEDDLRDLKKAAEVSDPSSVISHQ
jgi:hypothetical protein